MGSVMKLTGLINNFPRVLKKKYIDRDGQRGFKKNRNEVVYAHQKLWSLWSTTAVVYNQSDNKSVSFYHKKLNCVENAYHLPT